MSKVLEPGHGALTGPSPHFRVSFLLWPVLSIPANIYTELDQTGNREKVFKNLELLSVPAGEFFVKDVSDEISLSLQGPQSAEMLEALTGKSFSGSGSYDLAKASIVNECDDYPPQPLR
ncbi:MAG: hypothetical protein IPG76_23090 [Acidobacteria bacterium]|nr:hypothetical protein [Acidobacteriota bacterium]